MIVEALRHLAVPIDSLHPDPANARKHGPRNIDAIKASLAKFGQRKPIVVQRDGMTVRAGNGTLEAAKALGWAEIAAIVVDDDDATAVQFAIADNRTAELAEWDNEVLGTLLTEMSEEAREWLAFSAEELDAMVKQAEPQEPSGDPSEKLGEISFSVQVMCEDEHMQAELMNRLMSEGYTCKAIML